MIEDNTPILYRLGPFFSNLSQGQEHGLFYRVIIRERSLTLGVLADLTIQIFDQVGGVNDLSNLQREVKKDSQIFPVTAPGFNG